MLAQSVETGQKHAAGAAFRTGFWGLSKMSKNIIMGGLAALALLAMPATAQAEDLTFTLTNASSFNIANFYTSPANVDDWQEDVLGEDVMAAGTQADVTIADGSDQCVYDMKFVFEDGSEFVREEIDLCSLGEYTLSDN